MKNKIILFSIILGLTLFYIGIHNVDLAHNIIWFSEHFNVDLIDIDLFGNVRTPQELYIDGMTSVYLGLGILLLLIITLFEPLNNFRSKTKMGIAA